MTISSARPTKGTSIKYMRRKCFPWGNSTNRTSLSSRKEVKRMRCFHMRDDFMQLVIKGQKRQLNTTRYHTSVSPWEPQAFCYQSIARSFKQCTHLLNAVVLMLYEIYELIGDRCPRLLPVGTAAISEDSRTYPPSPPPLVVWLFKKFSQEKLALTFIRKFVEI